MIFDSETMTIYPTYGVFCGLLETVSVSQWSRVVGVFVMA
jgi:hypothetical protein